MKSRALDYRLSLLLHTVLFLVFLSPYQSTAQVVAMSLGSGTTYPGGSITLNITVTSSSGAKPQSLQWTMGYNSSAVTGVSVTPGNATTAAGKTLTCFSTASTTDCVVEGINSNVIGNGVVATATFSMATGLPNGPVPVTMAPVFAAGQNGNGISSSGTGGTITIQQQLGLSGLSCAPSTLTGPGSSTCTVTLNGPAQQGGFLVSLSSNNRDVTVPRRITVLVGTTSANFTANVGAVTMQETATLTASANGVNKSFVLTILPQTWSISGTIRPVPGGAGVTVTLSGATNATTTTDGFGNYSFRGLANGGYVVTPSKSGYTFRPTSRFVTINGVNVTDVNFRDSQVYGRSIVIDVRSSRDQQTASPTITSSRFSTAYRDELLLAFISTDYISGPNTTVAGVSGGGLTWQLVVRTNIESGTSEIWRAFAPALLQNVSVTARLSQSVVSSMTVVSYSGIKSSGSYGSGAIGATAGGHAQRGAPIAQLTSTQNNSWVFAVGNDYDHAIRRTVGPNQSLIHQDLSSTSDTYWVQMQSAPTPLKGTVVKINDTAPTGDRYNLSICEILPAGAQ